MEQEEAVRIANYIGYILDERCDLKNSERNEAKNGLIAILEKAFPAPGKEQAPKKKAPSSK